MPADLDKLEEIDRWVAVLMQRAGIRVVNFATAEKPAAPLGLIDVPGKYVAVIDAMHQAMHAIAHGDPLPEFAPLPQRSTKKVRRR